MKQKLVVENESRKATPETRHESFVLFNNMMVIHLTIELMITLHIFRAYFYFEQWSYVVH